MIFVLNLKKKTVLVIDNSPIHQKILLWEQEKEWSEKGLIIFWLPTYSPQLNIREI